MRVYWIYTVKIQACLIIMPQGASHRALLFREARKSSRARCNGYSFLTFCFSDRLNLRLVMRKAYPLKLKMLRQPDGVEHEEH